MAVAKYYAVKIGKVPGIYRTWKECSEQVTGFSGAKYKSFDKELDADDYMDDRIRLNPIKPKPEKIKYIYPSISVDAACSGNPGDMEYQGVDTKTGEVLFHIGPLKNGTNNIGEFLALVHGISYLEKMKLDIPIYTDSVTGMAWIKNKRFNSSHVPTSKSELEVLVNRAKFILPNLKDHKILKWDTKNWGQIPADFGRK